MKQMISLESSPQKRNFLVIESLQVGHVWVCVPHWFYFTLHSLTWAHSAPNFSTNFLRFLAAASRIAYTKHTRQEQNINIDNSERRISSPLSRHLALVCTCLLYMFYTVLLVRETLIHQGYCTSPLLSPVRSSNMLVHIYVHGFNVFRGTVKLSFSRTWNFELLDVKNHKVSFKVIATAGQLKNEKIHIHRSNMVRKGGFEALADFTC